ncbi:aldehyde dehydrogenase family protein [Paracoccus albus]|uniref:aldehyde dehydrogenase family protein n=1 Tax=Paracoccus albus TaxID=3017784 RepID=UPI0022F03B96|nr:aldehyde dehydrogenase family protein [Paracoccus albus]WBU59932.1 aldehyde dehydrogenase family protein [Paracoccus albus]
MRLAVLGGGLIGTGWAVAFGAAGHDVVALDPDPVAADRLSDCWQQARPVLEQMGRLTAEATPPRIGSTDDAARADFLQEALPEDLALKRRALRAIAPVLAQARAIASSSSTFTADQIAEETGLADRLLIGHPCNPPWLMPVVEMSAGSVCQPQAIDSARQIYEGAGKTVLTLHKPVKGHLVNRLQLALWREAVHLVTTGAASLEDTERAVTEALAPRWCDIGPHSVFALSGGTGGKNPGIIFDDADFEATMEGIGRACFANTGQVCLGTERIYVQRGVFDRVAEGLAKQARSYRLGDPFDNATTMGPVISAEHRQKVLSYYDKARATGANILAGGGAPEMQGYEGGYWVEPTVWTGLPEDAAVVTDEIFGPCTHLQPFDSEDEAVALANNSPYGLATSIWTTNLQRAHRVAAGVEVGISWVNCWFLRDLRTPFGGAKSSGIGREGGVHSMEFYSELRNVCVKL